MIDQDKMRALAAELRKYTGTGCVVDDTNAAADAIDLLLAEVEQNRIDQLEAHGEFELMTLANKRLSEDFALADSTIESKNRNIEEIVAHNNQLRAELEAAAADKRDAERWREIYNGHYIICKVYSNGDVQNLGGGYIGKYAVDAALAQRQGEGS